MNALLPCYVLQTPPETDQAGSEARRQAAFEKWLDAKLADARFWVADLINEMGLHFPNAESLGNFKNLDQEALVQKIARTIRLAAQDVRPPIPLTIKRAA